MFQSKEEEPLSVSEINQILKSVIESQLGQVVVKGELSNLRLAASGHLYFSLKDQQAVISAVLFRRALRKIAFELEDGQEVVLRGKVTVYPPRGSYQLIVEEVEPLGKGALMLQFEKLKARLEKEGLFSPEKKRDLPLYPKRVAVVTSESGAAIRDILNVLGRRNPLINVLVSPVTVQGERAADQIIAALKKIEKYNLAEVVILARGGGSLEDLWCFNDERLVRYISKFKIPLVCGVGHEIDFTLCDFAANMRAPTPSAAAEIVVSHRIELLERVTGFKARLITHLKNRLNQYQTWVRSFRPERLKACLSIDNQWMRLDELHARSKQSMKYSLYNHRQNLLSQGRHLQALSPLGLLERGWIQALDSKSQTIKSVNELNEDEKIRLRFKDGRVTSQVKKIEKLANLSGSVLDGEPL
jgi:exodeoxyribonuclease VII large subunit